MLVLSRKLKESIVIGEADGVRQELTVTVLEIRGGRVKLGFAAAPNVRVQRSEVWARIAAESQSDPPPSALESAVAR